jgi:hypothetical protein
MSISVVVNAEGSLLSSSLMGEPLMDGGDVVRRCIEAAHARAKELAGVIYT